MAMIGRADEILALERDLQKEEPQFVAVYGRRRIGKTFLIREKFRDQFAFYHTGVRDGNQAEQLQAFQISLKQYGLRKCPRLRNWLDAFSRLYELIVQNGRVGRVCLLHERLCWRKEAFVAETGVRKTMRLTLVTPVGIARNAHAGIVHNVVTLNDLFKE